MAASFDPYRKWLGILPKDQPPNHYRLLGIELFESDPDVIEGAADRQMAHLRTFQAGPHSAHSQKLLNECAAARVTLLDTAKRAEYDRQLRAKLASVGNGPGAVAQGTAAGKVDRIPPPYTSPHAPREEGHHAERGAYGGRSDSPSGRSEAAIHPLPPGVGRGEGLPPRSLPQARRLPAHGGPIVIADTSSAASAVQRQKRSRKPPLWRQPLAASSAGAMILATAAIYFIAGRDKQAANPLTRNAPARRVAPVRAASGIRGLNQPQLPAPDATASDAPVVAPIAPVSPKTSSMPPEPEPPAPTAAAKAAGNLLEQIIEPLPTGSEPNRPSAPVAGKRPVTGFLKIFEDEPEFAEALTADFGKAELTGKEKYSGSASVMITGIQRYREQLPGLNANIRKNPSGPDDYRYLRFAWKKRGGREICLQLHHTNGNWHRYSAGRGSTFSPAIRISDQVPAEFTVVTRDLAADFGEFAFDGLALSAADGEWACFDHIYLARSLSDFDSIGTPPARPTERRFSDLGSEKRSRLPVPDEVQQRHAKQALLKKVATAKSPEQKRKLALQFMEEASLVVSADANVYVLLSQAADLAEACGDLDLAWQANDELARAFDVDAVELRQQSLAEIAKTAKSPERCRELVDACCRLMISALRAGEAEVVKKTAAQAQSLSKRTKDKTLHKGVNARGAAAIRLSEELESVAAAREALKAMPDDPHANFVVGHWQLCVEDDWEPALVKLAKCDDAGWKKLAGDSRPLVHDISDPHLQITIADAWWAAAEKEPWPGEHYLRLHAGNWYRLAMPSLMGEQRAHAEQRLKLLYATDEGLPAWGLFYGGQTIGDFQRITRGGSMRTYVDYDGPIDVTFVARTDRLNIRLVAYDHDVVIWNWELNPAELRVSRPDGSTVPASVRPLEPDRWYELRYRITRQGTTIAVDGVPVFMENRSHGKFPRGPIGVTGWGNAVVDVKKFVVKMVE